MYDGVRARTRACGATSASPPACSRCSTTTAGSPSCSTPCCSRCPAARSSTTATRSGWATTSTSATATACARRCSGRPTATAGSARPTSPSSTCPPLMDPVYGYQAVNVEAETRNPSSFLHWLRRMLEVRKQHPVFGIGAFEVLSTPRTRRCSPTCAGSATDDGNETSCCASTTSAAFAQPVELMLAAAGGQGARRAARPGAVPADRRAAVLRHPAAVRLLLVPARTSEELDPVIDARRPRHAAARLPAPPAVVRRGRPELDRRSRSRLRSAARRVCRCSSGRWSTPPSPTASRARYQVPVGVRPLDETERFLEGKGRSSSATSTPTTAPRSCTTRSSIPSWRSRCSATSPRTSRSSGCGSLNVEQSQHVGRLRRAADHEGLPRIADGPNPDAEVTRRSPRVGFEPHRRAGRRVAARRRRPRRRAHSSSRRHRRLAARAHLAARPVRQPARPGRGGRRLRARGRRLGAITAEMHLALAEAFGAERRRARRRGPTRCARTSSASPRAARCDAPAIAPRIDGCARVDDPGRSHPHPRRLPPRPDDAHRHRLVHPRLRGRAGAAARGAPAAVVAAAGRRRHAPLVPLRGQVALRRARRRAPTTTSCARSAGRWEQHVDRARSSTATSAPRASTPCCPPTARTVRWCSARSSWTRRCTRSATSSPTGPTGFASRSRPSAASSKARVGTPDVWPSRVTKSTRRLLAAEIDAVVNGEHGTRTPSSATTVGIVRAWRPGRRRPWCVGDGVQRREGARRPGLFEARVSAKPCRTYDVEVRLSRRHRRSRSTTRTGSGRRSARSTCYLIGEGRHERLWEVLGAHHRVHQGSEGTAFAVWAPVGPIGAGRRRLQLLGRARPPHAVAGRVGRVGAVRPRRRARGAVQVRDPRRRPASCA